MEKSTLTFDELPQLCAETKKEVLEIKELIKGLTLAMQPKDTQEEEWLNIDEAAEFLRKSKHTVYKLAQSKKIKSYKPGGKVLLFKRSYLEEWVENGANGKDTSELLLKIQEEIRHKPKNYRQW